MPGSVAKVWRIPIEVAMGPHLPGRMGGRPGWHRHHHDGTAPAWTH